MQTLHFSFSDMDKIPIFCMNIKNEVRNVCLTVIQDNSKPFRANVRQIERNKISAVYDFHVKVKPTEDVCYEAREYVLLAILHTVQIQQLTMRW